MILYELGFHNITNVDFSSVLIEKFSLAYPHMKWICDDMRGLKRLPTCSFDVIIEKASIESLTVDEKVSILTCLEILPSNCLSLLNV